MPHHSGQGWVLTPPRSVRGGFRKQQHLAGLGRCHQGWCGVVLSRDIAKAVNEGVKVRKPGAKDMVLGSPHSILYA